MRVRIHRVNAAGEAIFWRCDTLAVVMGDDVDALRDVEAQIAEVGQATVGGGAAPLFLLTPVAHDSPRPPSRKLRAGARLVMRRMRALGLPASYADACAREAVTLAIDNARRGLPWLFFFRLRRAEYCARRYTARWGFRRTLPAAAAA